MKPISGAGGFRRCCTSTSRNLRGPPSHSTTLANETPDRVKGCRFQLPVPLSRRRKGGKGRPLDDDRSRIPSKPRPSSATAPVRVSGCRPLQLRCEPPNCIASAPLSHQVHPHSLFLPFSPDRRKARAHHLSDFTLPPTSFDFFSSSPSPSLCPAPHRSPYDPVGLVSFSTPVQSRLVGVPRDPDLGKSQSPLSNLARTRPLDPTGWTRPY